MTRIAIVKEVYERSPFIYALADTHERADAIAKTAWINGVQKNCHYWIRTVPDNMNIGDDI